MNTRSTEDLLIQAVLRLRCEDGSARRIRRLSRTSLTAIAQLIGVSASTVSRWERGQRFPSGAHARTYSTILVLLAEALDLVSPAMREAPDVLFATLPRLPTVTANGDERSASL